MEGVPFSCPFERSEKSRSLTFVRDDKQAALSATPPGYGGENEITRHRLFVFPR
jgi:hypothetical protein